MPEISEGVNRQTAAKALRLVKSRAASGMQTQGAGFARGSEQARGCRSKRAISGVSARGADIEPAGFPVLRKWARGRRSQYTGCRPCARISREQVSDRGAAGVSARSAGEMQAGCGRRACGPRSPRAAYPMSGT